MSDPFAGFGVFASSTPGARQGNGNSSNFMTTPVAPLYQQQGQPQLTKQPSLNQNIMSQFQTSSSTIQTNSNGPARTQYMTTQPPAVSSTFNPSPLATSSVQQHNPFADSPAVTPAYPFASQVSSSSVVTNPFGDPFGTHTPPPPLSTAIYQHQQQHFNAAPMSQFTTCPSATVQDFDPFSPKGSTPHLPFDFPVQTTSSPRQPSFTRATQENSRRPLDIAAYATATATPQRRTSVKDMLEAEAAVNKMSLGAKKVSSNDNGFSISNTSDIFAANTFANLDDDFNPRSPANGSRRNSVDLDGGPQLTRAPSQELDDDMEEDEYEVMFDYGSKLGVLMERMDVYVKDNMQDQKRELAVVKLVVEGGAADRIGVKVGSVIRGINHKDMEHESYNTVLELIKTAPRPMTIRLKERNESKETSQGAVLTRISSGTFSVGNLTAGNAKWDSKYFAFGGAKMDVLQLFVSRAAYHECVIALYEKRQVSTQIQSFRLYRDHKLSPIKSKIYKGYGNLHYFSLTVPSLRFVAAKFASENYDTIKNMWQIAFEAIEKKKRQAY
ncbi:hypothetical protein DYB37_007608 [Aphanomyces astaci]|uniref:PDZ domain-containing protein n=1 Tax=Aphanomyces astaci TaxID=112090 RepID=A0A3R7E3L3_APHAT|nr:hypothetical protein DYB35_007405 [Aphanomyces astaci]RHZ25471.1 hypothetical protein DYB37_007608 [Aphanomyces astaci]